MDEAIKQAREARAMAADFFSANPGQQYLCMGGAVHSSDGRARLYGSTTLMLSPEMTAAEAHQIAQERGQGLYVTQAGEVMCADSAVPGAVLIHVHRKPTPTEPTAAPCPPEPPDRP